MQTTGAFLGINNLVFHFVSYMFQTRGKYRYSFTLFLTSALDWGWGGQRHTPTAFHPGMTRYPLYRRLGGPQGRSGRMQIISPPPGFDPRTVQYVASRYTDRATPDTGTSQKEQFEHCNWPITPDTSLDDVNQWRRAISKRLLTATSPTIWLE
jgi:hypothetical protein